MFCRKAHKSNQSLLLITYFSMQAPRRHVLGENQISTLRIPVSVCAASLHRETVGHCHSLCMRVPTSRHPFQHWSDRFWSIFFEFGSGEICLMNLKHFMMVEVSATGRKVARIHPLESQACCSGMFWHQHCESGFEARGDSWLGSVTG